MLFSYKMHFQRFHCTAAVVLVFENIEPSFSHDADISIIL